ncbi:uncharacterized protein [Solanum lycopersicum]|uniref:uncharacterized protein n=1 Tax=Solanum lycopersicum TaxID=4081 RepID=UPI00374A3855
MQEMKLIYSRHTCVKWVVNVHYSGEVDDLLPLGGAANVATAAGGPASVRSGQSPTGTTRYGIKVIVMGVMLEINQLDHEIWWCCIFIREQLQETWRRGLSTESDEHTIWVLEMFSQDWLF